MGRHKVIPSSRRQRENGGDRTKKNSSRRKSFSVAAFIFVSGVAGGSLFLNWTVLGKKEGGFAIHGTDPFIDTSVHHQEPYALAASNLHNFPQRGSGTDSPPKVNKRPAEAAARQSSKGETINDQKRQHSPKGEEQHRPNAPRKDGEYEENKAQQDHGSLGGSSTPGKMSHRLDDESKGHLGTTESPDKKKEQRKKEKTAKKKKGNSNDEGNTRRLKYSSAELEARGMLGEYVLTSIQFSSKGTGEPATTDCFTFTLCRLAHTLQSDNPDLLPFFQDIYGASHCRSTKMQKQMNWVEAEAYLASQRAMKKVVPPTAFLHHEARCGSTLLTNLLASNPRALAYSEPPPVTWPGSGEYDKCPGCPRALQVRLLRLAVGLMGVSGAHDLLFFKLMPYNILEIDLFKEAFPATPYLWVHRDPVGVMMSQLVEERPPEQNAYDHVPPARAVDLGRLRGGREERAAALAPPAPVGRAPCVRELAAAEAILGVAGRRARGEPLPGREAYCAAYLGAVERAALRAMEGDPLGLPVAYEQGEGEGGGDGGGLAAHFLGFVLPEFLGVRLGPEAGARARRLAGRYSKARRGRRAGAFEGDAAEKVAGAWGALAAAAERGVRAPYAALVALEAEKVAALRRRRREEEEGAAAAGGGAA